MFINKENKCLRALASVGRWLYIRAAGASLPALTSVGSRLYISADGAFLPALESVGGGLYIKKGVDFDYSKIAFGAGEVLCVNGWALHYKDGRYTAGCKGPWTAEQALAYFGEDAEIPHEDVEKFHAAIRENEAKRLS